MKTKIGRSIAAAAFVLTVILVMIDGLILHDSDPLDGYGLASTYILPPIGVIAAFLVLRRTGSRLDLILVIINTIAFFSIYLYMFFGTILFGV